MHCTFCRSKNVQNKGESNLLTLPFTKSTENVGFVRLNKYIKCWELLVNNAFGQLEIAVFLVNPNCDFSIDQKLEQYFWSTHIGFY